MNKIIPSYLRYKSKPIYIPNGLIIRFAPLHNPINSSLFHYGFILRIIHSNHYSDPPPPFPIYLHK